MDHAHYRCDDIFLDATGEKSLDVVDGAPVCKETVTYTGQDQEIGGRTLTAGMEGVVVSVDPAAARVLFIGMGGPLGGVRLPFNQLRRQEREPEPGETFDVTVRNEPGTPLGVIFNVPPELPFIIHRLKHNGRMSSSSSIVRKDDRLVAISGTKVDPDNLTQLLQPAEVTLRWQRPTRFSINIDEGWAGPLGLVLGRLNEADFLVIRHIRDGAIRELNRCYKDRAVREFDCIVEVNSVRPPLGSDNASELLMDAIRRAMGKDLELKFVRYYTKAEVHEVMSQKQQQPGQDRYWYATSI